MTALAHGRARGSGMAVEARKLAAFARRDVLTVVSYRVALISDIVNLALLLALLALIGTIVDTDVLPAYDGKQVSYLEFAAIGIAVTAVMELGLGRVGTVLHTEQLMGTLESLVATPTSPFTVQLGSIAYHLTYMGIRVVLMLSVLAIAFGIDIQPSGILPGAVLLLAFLPFVWGLGVVGAAVILIVRRGGGVTGFISSGLALLSGAFIPVDRFPAWLQTGADLNPMAIAIDGLRGFLLGGAGWERLAEDLLVLLPLGVASIALGAVAFRLALRHERGKGTLGVY